MAGPDWLEIDEPALATDAAAQALSGLGMFSSRRCCITDVAVELFDQCLWGCYSEARQELEEFRTAIARSTNEKLKLFRELGHVLLDDEIEDPDVRAISFERVPKRCCKKRLQRPRA